MKSLYDILRNDEYRSLRAGVIWFIIALLVTRVMQISGVVTNKYAEDYFIGRYVNTVYLAVGYSLLLIPAIRQKDWLFVKFAAGAGIVGAITVQILKCTVGLYLPRPSGALGGFPSGHAEASFILAYILSKRYPRWSIPSYAMAAVITSSRVPHFHFFYQIVGGGIIGLLVVVLFDRYTRNRPAEMLSSNGGDVDV